MAIRWIPSFYSKHLLCGFYSSHNTIMKKVLNKTNITHTYTEEITYRNAFYRSQMTNRFSLEFIANEG